MGRTKITTALREGKVLVSDGAWGTLMQQHGLKAGECPELWNITHSGIIKDIAGNYIGAGADMVETNSFGGTCFKLEYFGLSDKVTEINEAAARLSREAAGENKWVIGSVGPTGKMLIMGDVTEDELYEAFRQQVTALEKGGADAVCIETMSDIDETVIAIRAAKENTTLEVIATFSFDAIGENEYRTMMGVSPAETATACIEAGADIVGTNCGNGLKNMVDIVFQIKTAVPDALILIHANAGLPRLENGVNVYPETPEQMAGLTCSAIEAGANIIGGCCGTTPIHISAIKEEVQKINI